MADARLIGNIESIFSDGCSKKDCRILKGLVSVNY